MVSVIVVKAALFLESTRQLVFRIMLGKQFGAGYYPKCVAVDGRAFNLRL